MPTTAAIRIAAAVIDDGEGRLLLVRKAGTRWFMQAGGKIEDGESPLAALRRELDEEIGLTAPAGAFRYLGRVSAAAANEAGSVVDADLFHLRTRHRPVIRAEIAEAVWVDRPAAATMALAPLTRDHVLTLAL